VPDWGGTQFSFASVFFLPHTTSKRKYPYNLLSCKYYCSSGK
jgi:hypothetical protein